MSFLANRPPIAHFAMKGLIGSAVSVFGLGLFWFSYWTFYNPYVEVPWPVSARFSGPGQEGRASVLFLGDFAPTDAALPLLQKYGYGYQFDGVRNVLNPYDVIAANLEAPITDHDKPRVKKKYIYKISPDAIPQMKQAGIDVLTLANNHMADYGRSGLADTLAHLDSAGIFQAGAGMSEADARRGLLLETRGGKLGILAYMQDKIEWRLYCMAYALDAPFRKWPGVARFERSDVGRDIARMRKLADVVAVSVHWGENYEPVHAAQKKLGHEAIDLGADIVIGHHAHQFQPVEIYKGRPILHGLGNFAFGTIGRGSMLFGMGAALHLKEGRLEALEFIPLLTQNRIVKYKTLIPTGKRLERFFSELQSESKKLGASIERRGDRGWLWLKNTQSL